MVSKIPKKLKINSFRFDIKKRSAFIILSLKFETNLYIGLKSVIIFNFPNLSDLYNMGEVKNKNCKTTGIIWAISLYLTTAIESNNGNHKIASIKLISDGREYKKKLKIKIGFIKDKQKITILKDWIKLYISYAQFSQP